MQLTNRGEPNATIVLGQEPTWIEEHAAGELRDYISAVTGAQLPISKHVPEPGDMLVVIGTAETNSLVRDAISQRVLTLSPDYPGHDGFIIKCVRLEDRDVLIIGGSQDRGTLYGVYAFIEHVLGVGFFRDGERVPKRETIDLPPLDIVERPYFPERHDGNGCFYHYTASGWEWEDWKRELDWKAKRRANIIWPLNVGLDTQKRVFEEWGLLTPSPEPDQDCEPMLHERAHEYAHLLGMRTPISLPNGGQLPDEFYAANPDARTLTMQWSELPPYTQLHPEDPAFKRLVGDYIRLFREKWGTDHLYIAEFASESRVLDGADDIQEARRIFARGVSEAILEADPEGVWVPSGWSFDLSADDPGNPWQANWTPEQVVDYLDHMTVEHKVWDLWSEEAAKYEATDYYGGHPWGFGVLHSFGAGSYLHGNVTGLIDRVHHIVNDPRGRNCTLFGNAPEIIDFNGFYLELGPKLAWNPLDVTAERHVRDWCRKRYGAEGSRMEEAWWLLMDTVYGPESGTVKIILDPLYWFRPDLRLLPGWPEDDEHTIGLWKKRPAFLSKLKRAMEVFLGEEELLDRNGMAVRDLVDIATEWVAEQISLLMIVARDSFLEGDSQGFESASVACLTLLNDQARILASWPQYRLDDKIERERKNWGDDTERAIKHTHVWTTYTEDKHSVPLRDYYRQDLDGLVADYYRPRVEAYFSLLRDRMAQGRTDVSDEEFDAIYTPIEQEFIRTPVRSLPRGDNPVQVVRRTVESLS